jgi:hypothetical protein
MPGRLLLLLLLPVVPETVGGPEPAAPAADLDPDPEPEAGACCPFLRNTFMLALLLSLLLLSLLLLLLQLGSSCCPEQPQQ